MTTIEIHCYGGQICSTPKECCNKGCCPLFASSVFTPLFVGHWYFWLAVTATLAGILCACSIWRKHSHRSWCCRDSGRDERASEPDSNGSCYAPPQYSRCNSFHQAPPPYSEVTSKPDLYPLVISYNGDPNIKNSNSSTGYLMVQYFRNFIVRPVGTLSATSTIDSLSSSFICNAANEANTIIPPPYSCMGSLEEVTSESPPSSQHLLQPPDCRLPRSASAISGTEYHQVLQSGSPSEQSYISGVSVPSQHNTPAHQPTSTLVVLQQQRQSCHQLHLQQPVLSIRDNPCFEQNTSNIVHSNGSNGTSSGGEHRSSSTVPNDGLEQTHLVGRVLESKSQLNCDASSVFRINHRKLHIHKVGKQCSQDSAESQEDEDPHNFSELLNLSVCVPSSVVPLDTPIQSSPHLQELHYSVTNSMTGSDISSLANLGTPDSPPRATSPTVEMKELLDKIQQLPQQKSPVPPGHQPPPKKEDENPKVSRGYFHRAKAKTLYMPLYEGPTAKTKSQIFSKSWLSRSAPNTPCGNFVPSFPIYKNRPSGSQKGSKAKITDGSPLLKEHEESEEDNNKDECL